MTINKLIEKYTQMEKDGYTMVFITQVLSDLRSTRR